MSITIGLHKAAEFTPDTILTRCDNRVRTYSDQLNRVSRLANAMQQLDAAPGDIASILAMNSDWYLEVILASAWSGVVFNPLNIRWAIKELIYGINDAGTKVLFVDASFILCVPEILAQCSGVKHVIYMGETDTPDGMYSMEALIAEHTPIEETHKSDSAVAGLFYTGGTTGLSKGVALSHNNLMTAVYGALATGDVVATGKMLHVAPLFHLAGIWPWLIQLCRGGTLVIMSVFDPDNVCDCIQAEHITSIFMVPTMINMVAQQLEAKNASLPELKSLLYAGSPIPSILVDKLATLMPNTRLCQTYGMTELSPVATLLLPEDHLGDKKRSVGRAAAHTMIRIIAADGSPAVNGDVGEITVSGANVMQGYLNRDADTALSVRDGWMYTGDAGYLDNDGYLYLVDRIKDMIVTGGENVFSIEVENVLASHPAISACAIIGVPDKKWGERVHAVVVLNKQAALNLDDIRHHVSQQLAKYKVPQSFTEVKALPLSAAGKVLKRELRDKLPTSI